MTHYRKRKTCKQVKMTNTNNNNKTSTLSNRPVAPATTTTTTTHTHTHTHTHTPLHSAHMESGLRIFSVSNFCRCCLRGCAVLMDSQLHSAHAGENCDQSWFLVVYHFLGRILISLGTLCTIPWGLKAKTQAGLNMKKRSQYFHLHDLCSCSVNV